MSDVKPRQVVRPLLLLITLYSSLFTSSCGAVRRMAANQIIGQLQALSAVAERQTDLALLRDAAPTSLLLLEAMVEQNPEHRDLLVLACRSFAGYAQAFLERTDPSRASAMYIKARDFGLRALKTHRGFAKALEKGEAFDLAVRRLDKEDMDAMFWTLTAWAAYVNLHLMDVDSLFDLPDVRALLFRVNQVDPDYFFSSPRVFLGVFYATLPAVAGGGADQARLQFEEALKATQGRFLMIRVLRAQYYDTLMNDEKQFDEDLRAVLEAPDELLPEAGVLNQLAKQMAADLQKRKDEIF
ncbi:MAG: hypothetical protein HYT87_01025 [Nitrospirae bacterium]|nr:hypothetical protein [Nitrospirota bacterium]